MCGIGAILQQIQVETTTQQSQSDDVISYSLKVEDLTSVLAPRGPDYCGVSQVIFESDGSTSIASDSSANVQTKPSLTLVGCVLSMRGEGDKQGNLLLWNGEIFDSQNKELQITQSQNDGLVLSDVLSKVEDDMSIPSLLQDIKGPWSIIYWQACKNTLWFGRNMIGQRSLVVHFPSSSKHKEQATQLGYCCHEFALSSVAFGLPVKRADQDLLSLSSNTNTTNDNSDENQENEDESEVPFPWKELEPSQFYALKFSFDKQWSAQLQEYPWQDIYKLKYPQSQQYFEAEQFYPFTKRRLLSSEPVLDNNQSPLIDHAISMDPFSTYVEAFLNVLSLAVERRVRHLPIPRNSEGSRVAVLFSGGIDSTVITALAHKYIPQDQTIDLLNVSFVNENSLKKPAVKKAEPNRKKPVNSTAIPEPANIDPQKQLLEAFDNVPDRKTGISAMAELCSIFPDGKFQFVKVNVLHSEILEHQSTIRSLLYPRCTIMDTTIGTALWFAARGKGFLCSIENLQNSDVTEEYVSPAKILLDGLGADEQLAGYGRHRTTFKRGGWPLLQEELELDFGRLWKRNLGRDDRLLSSHAREARFPFLDEDFAAFLNTVPLHHICDLSKPPGTGDKKILREAARKLGLISTSTFSKRAIQFGSRIGRVYFPDTRSSKINGAATFVNFQSN